MNVPLSENQKRSLILCVYLAVGILIFGVLYVIQPIAKPFFLALLLRFMFLPLIRRFKKWGLPAEIGSAIVLVWVMGGLILIGVTLIAPAQELTQNLPAKIKTVEERIGGWRKSVASVSATADKIQKFTTLDNAPTTVTIKEPSLFTNVLEEGQAIVVTAGLTLLFLYLMLSYGEPLIPALVHLVSPQVNVRNDERLTRHIEQEISRYLITISLIYAGLAGVVTIALSLLGIPNPLFWGILAGFFNYIPYLGIWICGSLITLNAILTFTDPMRVMGVIAVFLAIDGIEGGIITPLIIGRRFTLNPILILCWILLWMWLWGPIGGIMALPLLVTARIIIQESRTPSVQLFTGDEPMNNGDESLSETKIVSAT